MFACADHIKKLLFVFVRLRDLSFCFYQVFVTIQPTVHRQITNSQPTCYQQKTWRPSVSRQMVTTMEKTVAHSRPTVGGGEMFYICTTMLVNLYVHLSSVLGLKS